MENSREQCLTRMTTRAVVGALLFTLLVLAGCQVRIGPLNLGKPTAPRLPHAWTWYHDSQYPFDAPIPPGWQAQGYWFWVTRDKEHCLRRVDLVPPVSQPGYASNPDRLPAVVQIVIPTTCSGWGVAQEHDWTDAGATTIDGASAQQYAKSDEAGIQQMAIAHLGGHQYIFYFSYEYTTETPQSQAPADIALYQTILKNFFYHGQ